ncbi:MAG TPA: hypothetical protein VFY14_06985 [Streptomyces sp.]|nr:hypothetical protein [Streptomyces sp.]
MALKPDAEVSIALATSVMAYGAYQLALPSTADIRSLEANNADITVAERTAAWVAAAGVSFVALITKSPSVFVLGGATVVAASWMTRHANHVSNLTQRASAATATAKGADGVVGDEVAASQQLPTTPLYGVAV